jgi:hypothetical protein
MTIACDDGREVGAGIGEDIVDANGFQPRQNRATRRDLVVTFRRHGWSVMNLYSLVPADVGQTIVWPEGIQSLPDNGP